MLKFAITQSGPALGSGEQCFMVGLTNTDEHEGQFYGDADTLPEALQLLGNSAGTSQAFTIEYIPWQG